MGYTMHMWDEGSKKDVVIEADDLASALAQVDGECEDWVQDGEWGNDGAHVEVWWTLDDADGDQVADGTCTVAVDSDHDELIRAAGGDPDCNHDWTAEGEGGCTENPGVHSVGGTAMTFAAHCRKCGLHRVERSTGCQRNPGEHDTVQYEQPDHWCADCQSEDCGC